jgi:F1F0 ATPase subunit 2
MNDMTNLAWAFAAGTLLGSLFFGGLWWTTRKGVVADNPVLWFFASMVLRTGMMATGLYFVTNGDWRRAVACLLGFIAARLTALRLTDILAHRPVAGTGVRRES